jgi:hypothetical protein
MDPAEQDAVEAQNILGELIDALSDELKHEVGQSAELCEIIDRACRVLGGSYQGYVGSWL